MLEIVRLNPDIHDRNGFDCGDPVLNTYLQKQAGSSAKRSLTKTYVLVDSDNPPVIIAFYTLAFAECSSPDSGRLKTYSLPVPALKLCRMAVDSYFQKQGLGEQVLIDVIKRAAAVAANDVAPIIGLFVDAKGTAVDFYLKYGFIPVRKEEKSLLYLPVQHCLEVVSV
jgi:ribosomal protein S18 acetylase RimI-like enzyme